MLTNKTKLFKLSCTSKVIVTLNIQCTYGKLGRNTIPLIAMRSACAKVAILFWKSPNHYPLVAAMQRLKDDLFRPNNLETAANGIEVSLKRFVKSRKLLNFRNANYSTENSRYSGSKIEWKENLRKSGYTSRVCPLFGYSGKCCSTCYSKLSKIQTELFGSMEEGYGKRPIFRRVRP